MKLLKDLRPVTHDSMTKIKAMAKAMELAVRDYIKDQDGSHSAPIMDNVS